LDTQQQSSYQHWYVKNMQARQAVLVQELQKLSQQAENAEVKGDYADARSKINRARELQFILEEELGTTEDMRRESWRFFDEHSASHTLAK